MKRADDPRHYARVLALQTLFSEDFMESESKTPHTIKELTDLNEIEKYDEELFKKLVDGVRESEKEIDDLITKHAPQWPIDQIKRVDLEILRVALYEGFITETTPPKVSIDEAIELAKAFGGDASNKFVNGVLGAIYESKDKKK
jgi:N utilization substance protein B